MLELHTIVGWTGMLTFLFLICSLWFVILGDRKIYFKITLPIIIGVYLAILVIVNPFWLFMIFMGLMLVVAVFLSSLILSWQTLILGLPSMVLFCYSFFFGISAPWVIAIATLIFFAGLFLTFREDRQTMEETMFVFLLALMGAFIIPSVFPQFNLLAGIAELSGTAIALLPRLLEIIAHIW